MKLLSSLLFASLCFGAVNQTTITVTLSATGTSVTLTSSTGVSPAGVSDIRSGFYIDREYMEVTATTSANVWTVRRAAAGSRTAHASGTTVYIGRPADFSFSSTNPSGICSPGAQALPLVVIATGDVFDCPGTGPGWTLTTSTGNGTGIVYNGSSVTGPTPAQADNSTAEATTAYVQSQLGVSVPALVAKFDATAQVANITSTTLYAVPVGAGGTYRISAYEVITTAATSSSTLPGVWPGFTDLDSNVAGGTNSAIAGGSTVNVAGTTTAATVNGALVMQAKGGTNITFQTLSYASSGVTAMAYAIHLKLEYLGQ